MPIAVSLYPMGLSYRDMVDIAKLAEASGYDGVFTVEAGVHSDAMAAAQAIALGTDRIAVGTGIANLYLRHPAILGAQAVAIDELSSGRFILGIGVNNEASVSALGLTWKAPRQALRETTACLRQMFAGESPAGVRSPVRPARYGVPIHFAGLAMETAALAGEIADGLMGYLATPARFAQVAARAQQVAQAAGRDADAVVVSLLIPTFLSDDLQAARQSARRFLTGYMSMPHYRKMIRRSGFETEAERMTQAAEAGDRDALAALITDSVMDVLCLVGPASKCQEQLAAYREAGLAYPILAPQAVGDEAVTAVAPRLIQAFAP